LFSVPLAVIRISIAVIFVGALLLPPGKSTGFTRATKKNAEKEKQKKVKQHEFPGVPGEKNQQLKANWQGKDDKRGEKRKKKTAQS
jgi:hypothetical protein